MVMPAHEVMQLADGWPGTEETVDKMIALVNGPWGILDPLTVMTARNIVRWTPERDTDAEIRAVSKFVRKALKYQREGVETLASPRFILRQVAKYGNFVGDCDEATTLWAALHKILGHQVRFVVISLRKNGIASHIYGQVYSPTRGWIADDTIARPHGLGWEQLKNVTAKRLYDLSGLGDTIIARRGNEAMVYRSGGLGIIPLIIPAIVAVGVIGASVGAQAVMSKKGKKFAKKMEKKQEAEYARQEQVALQMAEEAEAAARARVAPISASSSTASPMMKYLAVGAAAVLALALFAPK